MNTLVEGQRTQGDREEEIVSSCTRLGKSQLFSRRFDLPLELIFPDGSLTGWKWEPDPSGPSASMP